MNKPQNYELSATYGHASAFGDKVSYEQVRNGINKGQNPIKLWREFKGLEADEMAARLKISQKGYNSLENGVPLPLNYIKRICWALDVHPTDLMTDNVLDVDSHYVAALADAHVNPLTWPLYSSNMRETTREILQEIVSPSLSYDELDRLYQDQAKKVGFSSGQIKEILEVALVNDGNPIYHQQGGLNHQVLGRMEHLRNDVKEQKTFLQIHDRTFKGKEDAMNRKGCAIYREKNWEILRPMVDELYTPGHPSIVMDFLQTEIIKPRRLNPVTDNDYKELVSAHDSFKSAQRVEAGKAELATRLSLNEILHTALSDFNKSNRCFIRAYDNRQLILAVAPDIAMARGNHSHPLFKNHAMATTKKHRRKPALN